MPVIGDPVDDFLVMGNLPEHFHLRAGSEGITLAQPNRLCALRTEVTSQKMPVEGLA